MGSSGLKARFFAIWTGQAVSLLGSKLISLTLIWWLTEQTGSAAVLAGGGDREKRTSQWPGMQN